MACEDEFKTVYVTIQPSEIDTTKPLRFSTMDKNANKEEGDTELEFDEIPWLDMSSNMLDFSASMGDLSKKFSKRTTKPPGIKKSASDRQHRTKDNEKQKKKLDFFRLLNGVKSPQDWNAAAVLEMLEETPSLAKKKYLFAAFQEPVMALHCLCALNAPIECVKKCFKLYTNALHDASPSIGTPLHYACYYNASSRIVRYLASRDRSALKIVNRGKRTPLHTAVAQHSNAELVVLLTEACPDATTMTDKDDMTPLDLAVSIPNPDLVVVEDLTEVNPTAISHSLHKAIMNDTVGIDILKDMMMSNPKALSTRDKNKNLPLHLMVKTKRSYKEMKLCMKHHPKATHEANGEGMTPYQLAKSMDIDDAIVDLIQPKDEYLFM